MNSLFRTRLLMLGLLALPGSTSAQVIRGTVTDDTGRPARGALVTVTGSDGAIIARTVSDSSGRYHVQMPRSGAFAVRTLRVGFVPSEAVTVTVAERGTAVLSLQAPSARIQLASFRVQGARTCRANGLQSANDQALWEQAIASLTAVNQSLQEPLTAATLLIDRVLDERGRRVLKQRVIEQSGRVRQPWRSMPIDSLRKRGFVWVDQFDSLTFIAPSVDVLLSQPFLEDHCLSPQFGDDRSEVGIAFEPVAARGTLPEIRGVIWLSTPSAELKRLEFTFTSVPGMSALSDAQKAGGLLRFARLPDGSVHIVDWEIRMPTLAVHTDRTRAARVASVQLSGGRTVVLRRGADTLFRHPSGALTGRVREASGRPAMAATVQLLGTSRSVTSDTDGRFALPDLLPGTYQLRIASAPMRALARDTLLEVTLLDTLASIDVQLPTSSAFARDFCAERGVVLTSTVNSVLAGVVRSEPQAGQDRKENQRVLIRWQDRTLRGPDGSATARTVEVEPDSSGAFHLCGLPAGASVTVRAVGRNRRSEVIKVNLSPDSALSFVTIPPPPSTSPSLTIAGTVRDSSGRAIEDAEVSIAEGQFTSRTDARGTFILRDVPHGDHEMRVRMLGYEPWALRLQRQMDDSIALAVSLRRVTVLESVRSVAPAPNARLQQFEANRRLGAGRFFTAEDLRRADGTSMRNLLAQTPGLRLVPGSGGRLWIASSRSTQRTAALARIDRMNGAQRACYVKVYRDGALVYGAAEDEPLFDLSTVRVEELEAVEFYAGASQLPSQYSGLDAACGALVLWTRPPSGV